MNDFKLTVPDLYLRKPRMYTNTSGNASGNASVATDTRCGYNLTMKYQGHHSEELTNTSAILADRE